jgi:hypothetical protein
MSPDVCVVRPRAGRECPTVCSDPEDRFVRSDARAGGEPFLVQQCMAVSVPTPVGHGQRATMSCHAGSSIFFAAFLAGGIDNLLKVVIADEAVRTER